METRLQFRGSAATWDLATDGKRIAAHVAPEAPAAATTSDRLVFITNYGQERHEFADATVSGDLQAKAEAVAGATLPKRVAAKAYRAQSRGGKGVKGTDAKDDDFIEHLRVAVGSKAT